MPTIDETSARNCAWRLTTSRLLWRSWSEDEYVVYHAASGDTHLLNSVSAQVLRQLERGPVAFRDLADGLSRDLGLPVDPTFEGTLAKLLVYLDEIGLVGAAS